MNRQYDLSHPVAVWLLWFNRRPRSREVMQTEITNARFLLWSLARTGPTKIVCFHDLDGPQNDLFHDVERVTLYAIDHRNAVIQLVTLLSHDEALRRLNQAITWCRFYDDYTNLYWLKKKDAAFGFMCDRFMGHTLGMRSNFFDETIVEEGARRTLKQLCWPLENVPLYWLAQNEANEILTQINAEVTDELL